MYDMSVASFERKKLDINKTYLLPYLSTVHFSFILSPLFAHQEGFWKIVTTTNRNMSIRRTCVVFL